MSARSRARFGAQAGWGTTAQRRYAQCYATREKSCHRSSFPRHMDDNMINHTAPVAERRDADLVADSLNGRPDAFRHIVERYQTLVCSIAYSATGSVGRSEDVAQETFLTAWRQLATLREPERLRSWLCGIVRNHAYRNWRGEQNQPVRNATPLEDVHDTPAPEPMPTEQAVSREEQAILWRSL